MLQACAAPLGSSPIDLSAVLIRSLDILLIHSLDILLIGYCCSPEASARRVSWWTLLFRPLMHWLPRHLAHRLLLFASSFSSSCVLVDPPLTSSDALASEGVRGGFQRMVGMISGWWEWPVGNQQEEKPVKGWGRASRGSRRRGREKNILPASHLYNDRPGRAWPVHRAGPAAGGRSLQPGLKCMPVPPAKYPGKCSVGPRPRNILRNILTKDPMRQISSKYFVVSFAVQDSH